MNKEQFKLYKDDVEKDYGIENPIGDDELVVRIEYLDGGGRFEQSSYEYRIGTLVVMPDDIEGEHIEFKERGRGQAATDEGLGAALAEAVIRFRK